MFVLGFTGTLQPIGIDGTSSVNIMKCAVAILIGLRSRRGTHGCVDHATP